MRRTHLRQHSNILKRQLIHVEAFNRSLILRKLIGAGTPREWRNRAGCRLFLLLWFLQAHRGPQRPQWRRIRPRKPFCVHNAPNWIGLCHSRNLRGSATDC